MILFLSLSGNADSLINDFIYEVYKIFSLINRLEQLPVRMVALTFLKKSGYPSRSRVERLLCQDIVIGFDKSIVFSYSSP